MEIWRLEAPFDSCDEDADVRGSVSLLAQERTSGGFVCLLETLRMRFLTRRRK